MPTKNQVIEELYRSREFNECIEKMEPARLRDDLKSEVALVLCEYPDEKIIGLYQRKELSWYVARIIINMVTNKYHPFFKTFRCDTVELNGTEVIDECEDNEREAREIHEDLTQKEIDRLDKNDCGLNWYDAEMVRLYLRVKSFRAMERETKIPHISCFKTVMKALRKLKDKAVSDIPKPLFTKEETEFIQNGSTVINTDVIKEINKT